MEERLYASGGSSANATSSVICQFILEVYLIKFRKAMQSIYIINDVNLLSYLQNNEAKNSVDEINIKKGKKESGDGQ